MVRKWQPRYDLHHGITPEAADAKLIGALRELYLVPETSMKTGSSEES